MNQKGYFGRIVACGIVAAAVTAAIGPKNAYAESTMASRVDYEFTGDISLSAPNFNDYLTFDPASRRLYVSHVDRVTVVDVESRTVVGSVAPLKDSHGMAIVPKLGKGYADSGDDGVVKVFNLSDLKIIKQIKVSVDADGMIFDESTNTILVVAGDSKNLTVINPADDTVTRTVTLPGKPEFFAVDGAGNAYINMADTASVVKVNIKAGTVGATWPLQRRLVFSSNGPGTITAISIAPNDQFAVVRTIPTFFGGRNMTLDPNSGELFVTHGHMKVLSSMKDVLNLKFGWDGIEVATFQPRP